MRIIYWLFKYKYTTSVSGRFHALIECTRPTSPQQSQGHRVQYSLVYDRKCLSDSVFFYSVR